jgi:hypothetical protein
MCARRTAILEQGTFITDEKSSQFIKSQRTNLKSIIVLKQLTVGNIIKENSSSFLQAPVPGPSNASDVSSHLNKKIQEQPEAAACAVLVLTQGI